MSAPDARAVHLSYGQQLAQGVQWLRSGEVFTRCEAERLLIRLIAVLMQLHQAHQVDQFGRCPICCSHRSRWRPWHRRAPCTVHAAFAHHLPDPEHQPNPAMPTRQDVEP